jgi:hypothetical protein
MRSLAASQQKSSRSFANAFQECELRTSFQSTAIQFLLQHQVEH